MNSKSMGIFLAAFMMMGISGLAMASEKDKAKFDLGKREYLNSCAVCHGADGRTYTPFADVLKDSPTDLRQLSRKNGGVFPITRVYEVIDGRLAVKAHGTRDMPIWGKRYSAEASPTYDDYPYDVEVAVRARILYLIDYLYRLQD